MKPHSDVAAVIPAKGTSQRTKNKNRQRICGVPLFLNAAAHLHRCLDKSQIFVDSECSETLTMAERAGFSTIRRPEELATNATDGHQLMVWGASQVKSAIVVQHMPTMPFLRRETLEKALQLVESGEADSAWGAVEEALYLWTSEGPTYDLAHIPNSFTLNKTIIEGMGLYVARRDLILSTGLRIPGRTRRVALDRFEAIDIDTPEDLEFARTVARGLSDHDPLLDGLNEIRMLLAEAA